MIIYPVLFRCTLGDTRNRIKRDGNSWFAANREGDFCCIKSEVGKVIHSRVFGLVRPQIEIGAGADLPFRYGRYPRHVLRDLKTWRGFDTSISG